MLYCPTVCWEFNPSSPSYHVFLLPASGWNSVGHLSDSENGPFEAPSQLVLILSCRGWGQGGRYSEPTNNQPKLTFSWSPYFAGYSFLSLSLEESLYHFKDSPLIEEWRWQSEGRIVSLTIHWHVGVQERGSAVEKMKAKQLR